MNKRALRFPCGVLVRLVDKEYCKVLVGLGLGKFSSRCPKKEVVPFRVAVNADDIEAYSVPFTTETGGTSWNTRIQEVYTRDIL